MNFSERSADPRRHLPGIAFVILLHVIIIYGLVQGLGHKVVEVTRAPIETKIIEEVKKIVPPPPRVVIPPPPLAAPPPPPFIPPPEIQIAVTPPPPQITVTTPVAPPAPVEIKPAPAPVPAAPAPAPAAAARPAVESATVVCANYTQVMKQGGFPPEATRRGLEKGDALVEFKLSANGEIKDVKIISATNPIFGRHTARLVAELKCPGQGHEITVQVPVSYTTE